MHNGERHVARAIESILRQTFSEFEFLIVDDGSTDGTASIVSRCQDPRIRLIRFAANRGLAAALNEGLAQARGTWVARQDADDVSHPGRLERQLAFLERHHDVVVLGSAADVIDDEGVVVSRSERSGDDLSIRWAHLFENPFVHTSVFFSAAAARAEGGFEQTFDRYCEDHALWSRLLLRGRAANLPERLVAYRWTASSLTGDLVDRPADDPRRREYGALLATLALRNLRAMFPDASFDERDGRLASRFVLGVDAGSAPKFMSFYRRLLDRFRVAHPEAEQSVDFWRTLARHADAIAYRVRPASRLVSVRVYLSMLRGAPRLAPHLSWMRALGLVAVGPRSRRRFGELRHRFASRMG